MCKYIYVSHGRLDGGNTRTDLDAIASLSMFWRYAKKRGLTRGRDYDLDMIDYFQNGLTELLKYRDARICVADVPPGAVLRNCADGEVAALKRTLEKLRDRNVGIHFIDHHPMTHEAREVFEDFLRDGLFLSLDICPMDLNDDRVTTADHKRCATEMVRDWLVRNAGFRSDPVVDRIALYTHDADFGIRAIPDSIRLSVIISADHNPLALAEMLADGRFWSDELEGIYHEQQARTDELLRRLVFERRKWLLPNGREVPVMYALMPPDEGLKVTAVGVHCIGDHGATVAVIVHRNPFISMRIAQGEHELHAGELLEKLGGGGHVGAGSAGSRGNGFPYEHVDANSLPDVVDRLDAALLRGTAYSSVRQDSFD